MNEPLPLYVQDQVPQTKFDALLTRIAGPLSTIYPDARIILDSFVESQKAPAYNGPEKSTAGEPIDHYPLPEPGHIADELTRVKQGIVLELFYSILREDAADIALLIQHNLVTANTTNSFGQTPLLAAVSTKNIAIVKVLLDMGADCNTFGEVVNGALGRVVRTPLMHAAGIGSLPIVKLLFEPPYSANDALVAPDGQIALRLAAENQHRAIVDYLPLRRAGGYLRFKTHNARNIERIKRALLKIAKFIKIFVWDIPKFFIWTIPKHLVVLPVVRSCKWCWENRKKFGTWCKHQLTEMPKRIVKFGKATWKVAKKVPDVVWKAVKKTPEVIWKAIKDLSKAVKEMGKSLWTLLTVRIPKAIRATLKWTWEGISSLARAIGNAFLRIVSFLHTVFEAIITFFRNVTLRDIWNAFCDFLRAVFVIFPTTLWTWIQNFGEVSYRIMKTLFGFFGEVLWYIACALKDTLVYIPKKLGIILLSLGRSFAKAFTEIRVWISPKS